MQETIIISVCKFDKCFLWSTLQYILGLVLKEIIIIYLLLYFCFNLLYVISIFSVINIYIYVQCSFCYFLYPQFRFKILLCFNCCFHLDQVANIFLLQVGMGWSFVTSMVITHFRDVITLTSLNSIFQDDIWKSLFSFLHEIDLWPQTKYYIILKYNRH